MPLAMIEIEKICSIDFEAVKQVLLADDQVKFAELPEMFLSSGCDSLHLHVIKLNGSVAGFFKLDTLYSNNYSFCPDKSLGLRSFVIDKRHQGKQLGQKAIKALFPYLKTYYSEFNSIYLTVNCKNPSAVACYQKGGFTHTNELYLGGAAGPQYIMYGKVAD